MFDHQLKLVHVAYLQNFKQYLPFCLIEDWLVLLLL
jgi:hypothetical protein